VGPWARGGRVGRHGTHGDALCGGASDFVAMQQHWAETPVMSEFCTSCGRATRQARGVRGQGGAGGAGMSRITRQARSRPVRRKLWHALSQTRVQNSALFLKSQDLKLDMLAQPDAFCGVGCPAEALLSRDLRLIYGHGRCPWPRRPSLCGEACMPWGIRGIGMVMCIIYFLFFTPTAALRQP
jgi:hypothetical protein